MCACVYAKLLQSCPALCNPMNCSLSGFSSHGILQARILEWVACSPLGDLPDPEIKAESHVSCIPSSSAGEESACNAGDPGLILGSGRSTGEGIGYPLQYSWASLVA